MERACYFASAVAALLVAADVACSEHAVAELAVMLHVAGEQLVAELVVLVALAWLRALECLACWEDWSLAVEHLRV